MSAADFDPLILKMRRELREVERAINMHIDVKRRMQRKVIVDTIIEWSDDGLRTGHQLDCIVLAARDID